MAPSPMWGNVAAGGAALMLGLDFTDVFPVLAEQGM
jgi:hypothetical protein